METIPGLIKYFLLLIAFTGFLIGLIYRKKHKELSHLYIYALASFLQILYVEVANMFFDTPVVHLDLVFQGISIHLFIIIEFVCIYLFFLKCSIIDTASKKIITLVSLIFLLTQILALFFLRDFLKSYEKYYFIESIIIIIPCFIYLYQLFKGPPILKLENEPSFWFTSGILIYFLLTFPVFFIIKNIRVEHRIQIMNTINAYGYIIIFSFLIKAYTCKTKAMK